MRPRSGWYAKALMVKSRRARSSSMVRTNETLSGRRASEYGVAIALFSNLDIIVSSALRWIVAQHHRPVAAGTDQQKLQFVAAVLILALDLLQNRLRRLRGHADLVHHFVAALG